MGHLLLPKIAAFCAYQDRSRPEIIQKMLALGIQEEEWEEIFNFLEKERFFSEKRFAHHFIGGKFRQKQWGKQKILFEIRIHQIPDSLIQQALQAEIPDEAYEETIQRLIQKKEKELIRENPIQRKAKLTRYLLQKGFTWSEFSAYLSSP